MEITLTNSPRFFYCFSVPYTLNFFIAERIRHLEKQRKCCSGPGIFGLLLLLGSVFQWSKPATYNGPKFILSKPEILVPDVVSN